MPSRSPSGNVTTYNALPPPKRQQTFPARRKSVKAKAAVPGLRKDQSTLTQLQFVPSTSRSDIIDMSTDDEFEDLRPKKKRRKSKFDGKEAGQSTLTQFDRSFSARKAHEEIELDEYGFQIWEDPDMETPTGRVAERSDERAQSTALLEGTTELEIPETSQPDAQTSVHAAKDILTPRKVHFKEVPSSQTPPSSAEYARIAKTASDAGRSPLKQRSVNMQPPPVTVQLSPESQNISMKMLERVRFQISANAKAQAENIRHPLFARTSTIKDSQSEGASLSTVSSKESLCTPQRRAELRHIHTIQDSQFDDGDELEFAEESQFVPEDTQHDYFDPANSALDRDALRFRWTQTQKQLSNVNEEDSDAETDDGDLDGRRTPRAQILRTDLPAEGETMSTEVVEEVNKPNEPPTVVKRAAAYEAPRPAFRDDSAYESGDHVNKEEVLVISSSPPLRASQVSTVMPTQASIEETTTRRGNIVSKPQRPDLIEPATVPISPFKPVQHFQPLSSSPFPLPPWSSPHKSRSQNQMNESSSPLRSSQLPKLVDYSLPPPPALSSSGRQTPASSSM